MKKILFLLPLLITALFGFSQSKGYLRYDSLYIERIGGNGELILLNQSRNQKGFLYNQGNGRTIFKAGVETLNDSTFVIGNDTLHINPSTFGSPVTASQSVLKTGDNFTLFGDSTTLTGFKVYGYDGSVRGWQPGIAFDPTGDLAGNGIVSQGPGLPWKSVPTAFTNSDGIAAAGQCPVSWVSDSTYHVGVPCSYYIGGVAYTSLGGDVKTKSDPTYDRQFAIVVNTSSLPDTVGGSAQPDPEVPTVEADQLFLTSVYVNAGDATATQVGQTIVYDEGTEWTISKSWTSTDNYATNPFHGTVSMRITGANSGQYGQFIAPAIQSKAAFTTLLLYVRNNSTFANVRNLTATLRNGNATQVGNAINLTTYGYSKTLLSAYQTIAIPMSAFAGADAFDRVRITNTQVGGTVDVQIDYVQLQSGIVTGPPANTPLILQQILDLENGKAVFNKNDSINVAGHSFSIMNGGNEIAKFDGSSSVLFAPLLIAGSNTFRSNSSYTQINNGAYLLMSDNAPIEAYQYPLTIRRSYPSLNTKSFLIVTNADTLSANNADSATIKIIDARFKSTVTNIETNKFALYASGLMQLFNGPDPSGAPTGSGYFWVNGGEIKVRDASNNTTTISPHNFKYIPEGPSDPMAWSHTTENGDNYVSADEFKALRTIENLTKEVEELKAFIYKNYKKKAPIKLIYKGKIK